MSELNNLPVVSHSSGAMPSQVLDHYYLELERKNRFWDYVQVFQKRKWVVLGIFLSAIILTALVCLLMTPIYRATTLLEITQDNPASQVNENEFLSLLKGQDGNKFQETQIKILSSRSLAWQIVESLNLQEHPDFREIKGKDPNISPAKLKEEMLDLFAKKLHVKPVKDSYLVEVSFRSTDQNLAQQVANAVAREYMQLAIDRRSGSFSIVKEWLERQLKVLAEKVQLTSKKMFEFGQKADIYALEEKDNIIVQKYTELSSLLTKAQSERMGKESQHRQIQERGPDAPAIASNPLIMNLRQESVAQDAKVASMGRIFLPGHPEMQAERAKLQELRGRLKAEVNRLQESVKADYEAAIRAEKLLGSALEGQKDQMANFQNNLVDFQILKRDAQTTEKLYQALLTRMGEATVASTMVASNIAVIDHAEPPAEPYLPRTGLFLGLSAVLGMFLGLGTAMVVEYLDDSIKTSEEGERLCQVPSLGSVPSVNNLEEKPRLSLGQNFLGTLASLRERKFFGSNPQWEENHDLDLVVLEKPQTVVSEAFRHLSASILLSAAGRPPKVLLITSPNPSEGKSTVAANLAISLAMNGRRTVLLDCDLRKPRQHRVFHQSSLPGLSNFLTGNANRKEILRPTQVSNLWFIPAGTISPRPTELLGSEPFAELLAELGQEFSHLIIDTPPILAFADGRVMTPLVDGVVLVIRQNHTPRESGRMARQLLAQIQARVLGLVLNMVSTSNYGAYYYYNQKHYEQYYGGNTNLRHGKEPVRIKESI